MRKRAIGVLCVAASGALLSMIAPAPIEAATERVQDVFVRNTAQDPVVTRAVGATEVNGTVSVGNLPATQAVSGTVQVGNLPQVQGITGTVGIDPARNMVTTARGIRVVADTTMACKEDGNLGGWCASDILRMDTASLTHVTIMAKNDGSAVEGDVEVYTATPGGEFLRTQAQHVDGDGIVLTIDDPGPALWVRLSNSETLVGTGYPTFYLYAFGY